MIGATGAMGKTYTKPMPAEPDFMRGRPMATGTLPGISSFGGATGRPTAAAMTGATRPMVFPQAGGETAAIGGPSMGGPGGLTTPGGPASTLPAAFGGAPAASRGPGSTQGILDAQFGTGGMFDPTASNFGQVEQYARDSAQRMLDSNLAALDARYGASGFGNSSRSALARGEAIGNTSTNLGSALAQLREGSRQSDLSRAMQGILGAGQIDLSRQQFQQGLPFQGLDALAKLGTGLLATGQSEQVPAFLAALMPFLTGFGSSSTFGSGRSG